MNTSTKLLRSKQEDEDSHGSWAISYGDLVTILLSFFILFFSTDFGEKSKTQLDNSLVESVEGTLSLTDPINKIVVDDSIQIKKINKDNFLIFFKNISFFDSGRVTPNEKFHNLMTNFSKKVSPFLSNYKLVIHAYTDSSPVTKKSRFRDNVELSGLRAIAVKSELEKIGIDANRMEISGKGVLSRKVIEFMGISLNDKSNVKKLQRTVAFVVRRDQSLGDQNEK